MVFLGLKDPFESTISKEIARLQNEMNTLFERFFGRSFPFIKSTNYPAVNIYHDNENLYITAELPGVKIEDLDITLEEDTLTLKGEKKSLAIEGATYYKKEREEGTFSRVISLPIKIEPEKATASLKNGILTVTIPKAEEAKPKKIEIKVS